MSAEETPSLKHRPGKATPATFTAPKEERLSVTVARENHVMLAQQAARGFITRIGFQGMAVHYVLTSVSELASNLFFHTDRGGTITLVAIKRSAELGVEVGVEVIAEDDGPGIPDIELALEDGFSTRGGLGGGLPGVARLSDEFEITSTVDHGTRVVSRKWQLCK